MRSLPLALSVALVLVAQADGQTKTRPKAPPPAQPEEGGGGPDPQRDVPEFFGEPVTSTRIAFVIDVSGSMSTPLNGRPTIRASALRGGKRRPRSPVETRLDRVKRELLAVVDALPDEAKFNVHWFQSTIGAWKRKLTEASPKQRANAKRFVQAFKPLGATNLYDALATALADPEVETVFLLSDGNPNKGRYSIGPQILRAVASQLRGRKVTIHTVSVGPELGLMRELAKQHGGNYHPH